MTPQPESRRSLGHKRKKLSPEQIASALAAHTEGVSWDDLAKRFGVSERVLRELTAGIAP